MSEARSLTPLSEADYDAIEAAVMETARGRWFMSEFARRNRQADTLQLLDAIARLERVVDSRPVAAPALANGQDFGLQEAASLIADLRLDLERIRGRSGEPSSGLAARTVSSSAAIGVATEAIQEAAWALREAGAGETACDALYRRSTELYAANAVVEGTADQIAKIADTIAMLDSSLRAFCEQAAETRPGEGAPQQPVAPAAARAFDLGEVGPLSSYEDIEVIEIDASPKSALVEPRPMPPRPAAELKLTATSLIDDDLIFHETGPLPEASQASPQSPAPPLSEADLRAIDRMSTAQKLAYFA